MKTAYFLTCRKNDDISNMSVSQTKSPNQSGWAFSPLSAAI
jgi:hypothetical protein